MVTSPTVPSVAPVLSSTDMPTVGAAVVEAVLAPALEADGAGDVLGPAGSAVVGVGDELVGGVAAGLLGVVLGDVAWAKAEVAIKDAAAAESQRVDFFI